MFENHIHVFDDFWGCATHWHILVNGVRKGGRIPGVLRFQFTSKTCLWSCLVSSVSDSCGLVLNPWSSWETLAWPGGRDGKILEFAKRYKLALYHTDHLQIYTNVSMLASAPLLNLLEEDFLFMIPKNYFGIWKTFPLADLLGSSWYHTWTSCQQAAAHTLASDPLPFVFSSFQKIFCESHFHSSLVISPQTGMRGTPSNAKVTSNLQQTWGLYISPVATLASQ